MSSAEPMSSRCGAKTRDGGFCTQPKIGTRCRLHSGKSVAKVRAEAAVKAEVERWGLGDTTVDPGEVLLRLVTQSAWRCARYAAEIERITAEAGTLVEALTGDTYTVDEDGRAVKTGEYIRAMTQLEAQERDRCANFATKAIAAGLAERQVRIAERAGAALVGVVTRVLDRLGLPVEQRAAAAGMLAEELAAVGAQKTIEA